MPIMNGRSVGAVLSRVQMRKEVCTVPAVNIFGRDDDAQFAPSHAP
jgi:hypothetical protein